MADAKAIFVDGANLWNMMRVNGIGKPRHDELMRILVEEVGAAKVSYGKPRYVLTADQSFRRKTLEYAGFEVVFPNDDDSGPGADDRKINELMLALGPGEISEIVLVSSDFRDYYNALEAKRAQGIKVVLVATKTTSERGARPMLSEDFVEGNGIAFVELAGFKERIMIEPFVDKKQRKEVVARAAGRNIRVNLIFPESDDGQKILKSIIDLLGKYSTLEAKIEVQKEGQ